MADPDLQRGDPVSKKFFLAFGPQFGLKIREGGRPLDLPQAFLASRSSTLKA